MNFANKVSFENEEEMEDIEDYVAEHVITSEFLADLVKTWLEVNAESIIIGYLEDKKTGSKKSLK